MALIEVKINIQNREITGEPQTNGTYKIRQIVIKIMELTHILLQAKSKQFNKIKYNRLTRQIKETKDHIYQSNKTNQNTNWKTKLTKAQTGKQN